jgi:hypothetical protein
MSAGFKVAGVVSWGTNGAVEVYVESMAGNAAERFGPDDPLAVFLREERDGFFTGKVVFLDEWLADDAARDRLLAVLDAATEQLLREGVFSEYGREWVSSVVGGLRERIARGAEREGS